MAMERKGTAKRLRKWSAIGLGEAIRGAVARAAGREAARAGKWRSAARHDPVSVGDRDCLIPNPGLPGRYIALGALG